MRSGWSRRRDLTHSRPGWREMGRGSDSPGETLTNPTRLYDVVQGSGPPMGCLIPPAHPASTTTTHRKASAREIIPTSSVETSLDGAADLGARTSSTPRTPGLGDASLVDDAVLGLFAASLAMHHVHAEGRRDPTSVNVIHLTRRDGLGKVQEAWLLVLRCAVLRCANARLPRNASSISTTSSVSVSFAFPPVRLLSLRVPSPWCWPRGARTLRADDLIVSFPTASFASARRPSPVWPVASSPDDHTDLAEAIQCSRITQPHSRRRARGTVARLPVRLGHRPLVVAASLLRRTKCSVPSVLENSRPRLALDPADLHAIQRRAHIGVRQHDSGERVGSRARKPCLVDRLLHDPASCDPGGHAGTMSVVRQTTIEMGAISRLGSVGNGHAIDLKTVG